MPWGTQKEIAQTIRAQGAASILAVKGNQATLQDPFALARAEEADPHPPACHTTGTAASRSDTAGPSATPQLWSVRTPRALGPLSDAIGRAGRKSRILDDFAIALITEHRQPACKLCTDTLGGLEVLTVKIRVAIRVHTLQDVDHWHLDRREFDFSFMCPSRHCEMLVASAGAANFHNPIRYKEHTVRTATRAPVFRFHGPVSDWDAVMSTRQKPMSYDASYGLCGIQD